MNLPSTVERIDTISDMGGDYIEIVFKNGATVRVSAENDGIHYNAPGTSIDTWDNPTASLLVDLGGGHHDNPNEVTVMRGPSCKRMDFDKYMG